MPRHKDPEVLFRLDLALAPFDCVEITGGRFSCWKKAVSFYQSITKCFRHFYVLRQEIIGELPMITAFKIISR
ncbi:MAG: hypothetical protein ACFFD4_14240 [Candidatus Odinarchaeota archaeon]